MYKLKPIPYYLSLSTIVVLLLCITRTALSSPWISVGETRLKQHLHLLNDTGVINLSLSTWPVMWADVDKAISEIDEYSLNTAQKMLCGNYVLNLDIKPEKR